MKDQQLLNNNFPSMFCILNLKPFPLEILLKCILEKKNTVVFFF